MALTPGLQAARSPREIRVSGTAEWGQESSEAARGPPCCVPLPGSGAGGIAHGTRAGSTSRTPSRTHADGRAFLAAHA